MQRLFDSSQNLCIDVDYTSGMSLVSACRRRGENNGVGSAISGRSLLRGYGEAGVNPSTLPTEVYIWQLSLGKNI